MGGRTGRHPWRPTDRRRFPAVEGPYRNRGTIAPLEEIVEPKEEFCYRPILDDSHGIGALGENGRGLLENHGLRPSPMVHAEVVTFSLENALGSVGGVTIGSEEVVDHQRLSGAGYRFGASAPPFLSKVCTASVRRLEGRPDEATTEPEEAEGDSVVDEGRKEIGAEEGQLKVDAEKENDPERRPVNVDELCGPALLAHLRENTSALYATLTNPSHPHALELRHRLSITSRPLSPMLYLRLADEEATRLTRAEQTSLLDRIARHCPVEVRGGEVSDLEAADPGAVEDATTGVVRAKTRKEIDPNEDEGAGDEAEEGGAREGIYTSIGGVKGDWNVEEESPLPCPWPRRYETKRT